MTTKRLTDTSVRQARPRAAEYQLHAGDVPGLFLRVRPNGSKDWLFRYTLNDARRKIAVGNYPTVSLAEARGKAQELRHQIANNIDPQLQRIKEEADRRAIEALVGALPQTLRQLFDLWEQRELRARKDHGKEVRRKFEKDVLPRLGDFRLADLRRAHITEILDAVRARGAPRIASMLLSDLRQMFMFGVVREILPADPTAGLKKSNWGGKGNERDRVLSEAEIRQLAKALPATLTEENQRAIWIMLSTCCRIGEITKARWVDVDFETRTWKIPESKNGKQHVVNLSDFALDQFRALERNAENVAQKRAERNGKDTEMSEWVMPARHHDGCVCSKSLNKQIADRQRGSVGAMSRRSPDTNGLALPNGKWTPHDLRRTGATLMGELGIRVEVIEKCLNHTEQNRLIRIYQRQEQRDQMRMGWALLGTTLQAWVAPLPPTAPPLDEEMKHPATATACSS